MVKQLALFGEFYPISPATTVLILPNLLATPEHITLQHNSRPTPHTYYGLLRLRRFGTRKLLATTLRRKLMHLVANQTYISNIYRPLAPI